MLKASQPPISKHSVRPPPFVSALVYRQERPRRDTLTGDVLGPVHFDLTGFPPTVQVIGDCDEAFELSQVSGFHDKLQQADVKSAMLVVPGASHGFESMSRVGDRVHNRFLTTACDIVEEFAMISFM